MILTEPYEGRNFFLKKLLKYKNWFESYLGVPVINFINEPYNNDSEDESFHGYLAGEPYNRFYPDVLNNKTGITILNGYWQSEKYFKFIENMIREDFSIIQAMPDYILDLSEKLQRANSVCIGIRQYSDSTASAGHYKLDSDYYKKAIDCISEKVTNPEFYVFTLEKEWVLSNIKTCYPLTVVEPSSTNETAYIDLYLMTQCKHFIIANSTYHWWGAWLSKNKEKIVIAPSRGWGNECAIPDNWIKI